MTLFYWFPPVDVLKWFRIIYTVCLSVASRWVFVQSNVNLVAWHLHNTALISALIGMWLVTVSHFLPSPNLYFNTLANDFFLTALPSFGLFGLVFSVLYVPNTISHDDLQFITIFDSILAGCLLIDTLWNAIVFDINELSVFPIVL